MTRADIKRKADEWAGLQRKLAALESKRNAELDPHIRAHQEATDPIYDKYDQKIAEIRLNAAELGREIDGWLIGQGKAITIEGDRAVAAAAEKAGPRVIDPKEFYEMVRTKGTDF